ncbi:IS3 family transposase, partial [Streptococcus suis]|uniref:IS3 family transposase n=1 Tax=Streptococcus suis TaxID=1307 RepID=UPI0029C1711A
ESASFKGRSQRTRKAQTVREMVAEGFRLDVLLTIAQLVPSTYHYQVKQLDKPDKDLVEKGDDNSKDLKAEIQAIYDENKGNYGYRRIHLELRNRGFSVNHKKVQRLMKELGLTARIRRRKRYKSYKGDVG